MLWESWQHYLRTLRHPKGTEAGQGLVEYAMILVLVVIVVIVIASMLGPWVGNVYSNVISYL